jgi:4'-phosphopantetheinyl transferase
MDRREYLTTRVLVRTALSYYHPLAPVDWRFESGAYGKPTAEPDCGLRFNLSNSPGLVVCLIARGLEVGVDVEPYDRAGEIVELAPEVFSRQELAQFERLRGQERLGRALSLWTLKEAYTKARGLGLSLPMREFSFLFDGTSGIRLELDPGLNSVKWRGWRFCLVDHAGHRIALIAEQRTTPG